MASLLTIQKTLTTIKWKASILDYIYITVSSISLLSEHIESNQNLIEPLSS